MQEPEEEVVFSCGEFVLRFECLVFSFAGRIFHLMVFSFTCVYVCACSTTDANTLSISRG